MCVEDSYASDEEGSSDEDFDELLTSEDPTEMAKNIGGMHLRSSLNGQPAT